MKNTEQMVQVNKEQAKFYDAIQHAEDSSGNRGYAENRSANFLTRIWADLRYRQQSAVKEAGIEEQVTAAHERWIRMKAGGKFLEVGCFSGSRLTFQLAEMSGQYLGVELSPKAVEALNGKFSKAGLSHKARAEAVDFLQFDKERTFDLIYAHGVLHHFENPIPLFEKLLALAKPDALLIFCEPSTVNPLYRVLRAAYRPFQSDAPWEWPFTNKTVNALEKHFAPIEGFGWGRWSLPLSVMTGFPVVGRMVKPVYMKRIASEVRSGWHPRVWHNSYVTAVCRRKTVRE